MTITNMDIRGAYRDLDDAREAFRAAKGDSVEQGRMLTNVESAQLNVRGVCDEARRQFMDARGWRMHKGFGIAQLQAGSFATRPDKGEPRMPGALEYFAAGFRPAAFLWVNSKPWRDMTEWAWIYGLNVEKLDPSWRAPSLTAALFTRGSK